MLPKRHLITGAAGFIGSHAADTLLRSGHEVIGVDDLGTGRPENLRSATKSESFRFIYGDVTEPGLLDDLCRAYRPDTIIHLAGLVSVVRAEREPDLNHRLNLESTRVVAEAARRHGIGRVVFASSAAIYGDAAELPCNESAFPRPSNLYGASKSSSEQLLLGYGSCFSFETVSLRFFNVFGPRQDPSSPYSGVLSIFAQRYAQGRAVRVFGDGSQTRDFVSVFDVARAIELAAARPGVPSGSINVCSGRSTSLLEVIDSFDRLAPAAPAPIFEPARPGEIQHSRGNPDLAAEALGFRAEVSLDEGIRSLLADLDQRKLAPLRVFEPAA